MGVLNQRDIAVPRVGLKERFQGRQTQGCYPLLLPFFTIWVAPREGREDFLDKFFRAIFLALCLYCIISHHSMELLPTLPSLVNIQKSHMCLSENLS